MWPTARRPRLYHQAVYKDLRAVHVAGTVYEFTAIEVGRPVVVFGPDGERLLFDRGQLRYTVPGRHPR